MKRHLIGLIASTGVAILGGCFSGSDDDAVAGEGQLAANKLDDAVATSILAGGCDVVVGGKTEKTKGSGGKCPTRLSDIMDLLENDLKKADVFVVSEKADLPDESDTTYRFVVGSESNKQLLWVASLTGHATKKTLGEDGTEAMGFSPSLQAFVYYKVERGVWVRKGDGSQVSPGTDGTEKPFECIGCHTTGAPLMKELHDSWGNWESTWFSMSDPKDANPLFKRLFDNRQIADDLEVSIIDGIHLHSKGRVDRAAKAGELSGVLKQLMCEVGEPSIIGAHSANSERMKKVDTFSSMLPQSILLNQLFIAPDTGGTGVELGLEQSLNVDVPSFIELGQAVDAEAYSKGIAANKQTIGGKAGDAIFPMSAPQKSYADLDAVQELLRQRLIDKDIVADILMTDFTVSSFSKVRCDLAQTMPKTWKTPAELKTSWANALAGSKLRGAAGLKARLENTRDLKRHEAALEVYLKACTERKADELTVDLLKIISQRRVEFSERYASVIESDWLIPRDNLRSRAGAIRLSADTCEVQDASAKFGGEE